MEYIAWLVAQVAHLRELPWDVALTSQNTTCVLMLQNSYSSLSISAAIYRRKFSSFYWQWWGKASTRKHRQFKWTERQTKKIKKNLPQRQGHTWPDLKTRLVHPKAKTPTYKTEQCCVCGPLQWGMSRPQHGWCWIAPPSKHGRT